MGKGFAVVASEISKLATNSKDSINQIGNIVNDISNKIIDVDSGLETMNAVTKKQSEDLNEIVNSLKLLDEYIKKMLEITENI